MKASDFAEMIERHFPSEFSIEVSTSGSEFLASFRSQAISEVYIRDKRHPDELDSEFEVTVKPSAPLPNASVAGGCDTAFTDTAASKDEIVSVLGGLVERLLEGCGRQVSQVKQNKQDVKSILASLSDL